MGSGGIKKSENQLGSDADTQRTNATQLNAQGQQFIGASQDAIRRGQANQSPLGEFLRKIISGDSTTTNQALAPVIANITAGTNANRENIFRSTAPGAGRDLLLGQNQLNRGTQIAGATNQTFLQAFPELAQLGGQQISQGLGQTNAGLGLANSGASSLQQSVGTTGTLLANQKQDKAQSIGNIMSIASLAGGIATGGLGLLGGAGKSLGSASLNPGSSLFSNTTGGDLAGSSATLGFPFGGG